MIRFIRQGRRIATDPIWTPLAPAIFAWRTAQAESTPPHAQIGFVRPQLRAFLIQSQTIGRSGHPDNPPPPRSASGDFSDPNNPYQSILSGSIPQWIVLDIVMASHAGCFETRATAIGGTVALNLHCRGILSDAAMSSAKLVSLINSNGLSPAFGQEKFISSPTGPEKSARCWWNNFTNVPSSCSRSSMVLLTDMNEIKKGLVRICHPCFPKRVYAPGPESPTAFRSTPLNGFTIIHFG